ncbi:MAG TPA: hypothetical protein VGL56_20115 [Fimbriimonadaceae bacterium]|jgi:hypothetical protein
MKKALIFLVLSVASVAHSQDLYNDFQRVTSTEYDSLNKVQIVNTAGKSNFLVGNVDAEFQVLRQIPIVPLTTTVAGGSTSAVTDQVFGSATYHFNSGVWWNLGSGQYKLPSGVVLPGQSVVMLSEDAIPTIQFEGSGPHSFTTTVTSLSGAPTPGNLIVESFFNGEWAEDVKIGVGGLETYQTSISNSGSYKIRWILQRTGAAPAVAKITINVS